MTTVISGRCMSAGGTVLESSVISFGTRVSGNEWYIAGTDHDEDTVVFSGGEMLIFPTVGQRSLLVAPFDNPSTVPLYSHVSEPTQPPKTVFIRDLSDPRLSLVASIPIALEFWRELVTACCYDLEDFGVGSDEFSALTDLKASLVELYFILKADAKNLGPLPQRHWDYLRTIIREH